MAVKDPILTDAQFEHLHKQADSRAEKVKVDQQALMNLLIDYGKMLADYPERRRKPK